MTATDAGGTTTGIVVVTAAVVQKIRTVAGRTSLMDGAVATDPNLTCRWLVLRRRRTDSGPSPNARRRLGSRSQTQLPLRQAPGIQRMPVAPLPLL